MGRRRQQSFQMANKKMKRCSTSLDIREMQFETTITYDYRPIRIAKLRKNHNDNAKCWPGNVGKLNLPYSAGGNVKWTKLGFAQCRG